MELYETGPLSEVEAKIKDALSATSFDRFIFTEKHPYHLIEFDIVCACAPQDILGGTLDMKNPDELALYDTAHLKEIVSRLEELNRHERELQYSEIEKADREGYLDETVYADHEPLPLEHFIIYPDGSFRLGYNAGDTVAGEMFIYVGFSPDFVRKDEVTFEIY